MILLWKIIIAVNIVSIFVDCQFENQYLGHYLTREQYNGKELACDTKVCLRDANLLLLKATQNKTIEPCDDFAEFSMGQFKKLGALNERYSFIGFMRDLVSLDWERKRKVLAEKIIDTDIRPFKIAKNFYQKCVNSDNVRMNGSVEILQHVKSYGGAPFLDSSWDENNFNIKELFEKEPFNAENKRLGTIKSKQRWEQCVLYLYNNFGPALKALYAAKYYEKEVYESVKSLMKEAVKDLIGEINKLDIKDEAKLDVVERLNTARYIIGYPVEVLDLQIIDDFYKELELDETNGVVESFLKIERYNKKLKIYPESKKQFHFLNDFTIKFGIDENIILIHQSMIMYPFYHPNRSRFFNTATLYQFTAESMNHLIRLYLQTKWDTQIKLIDTLELAYKNYVKWEESGGKELQLPGFFLTNRQMFWVALAHKKYHKFQTGISKITVKKFQHRHTHFHLQLKNQLSFRQAYNCTDLTEDEKNKLNKYYLEKEMFERQYIIDYQLKYP
ncbi:unnamed protein product [Diamesa hyperborea]